MIRVMVDENAKQMGQNSAAIKRIVYLTLTGDWGDAQEFLRILYGDEGYFKSRPRRR